MYQEPFFFETLLSSIKWLIIFILWALLAAGLRRDLLRIRQRNDSSYVTELLYALHKRNIYVYGLVSMLLVIVFTNDIHHLMEHPSAPTATAQQPALLEPAQPVVTAAEPAEQKPVAAPEEFPVPHDSGVPFSDITEFNEANGKQQAYIDLLKQRYETWIITYYYLKKCGKVEDGDLALIMASLRKELQNTRADSASESNIVRAADGSYKEMYSAIPCDEAHITSTKASYDSTMQRIIQRPATTNTPQVEPAPQQPAPTSGTITLQPVMNQTAAPVVPATIENLTSQPSAVETSAPASQTAVPEKSATEKSTTERPATEKPELTPGTKP